MDKAEQILEKHINENDLNFIFHENKDLWQELLNATNEALTIPDVVGQSEQLKAEVFTLANKLAISGEGDAAVAMHRIHNRL